MSIEQNIKTAEEHLEAEANRELDRLLATLVEDSIYEECLLEKPVQGKTAIAEYYQELWKAFPDFTYVVTNRVADESSVIYEMTFRGTHTGPFRGIPPDPEIGGNQGSHCVPDAEWQGIGGTHLPGQRLAPDAARFLSRCRERLRPVPLLAHAPPPLSHHHVPPRISLRSRVSTAGVERSRRLRSRGPRSCGGYRRRLGQAW